MKINLLLCCTLLISACGSQQTRIHKKQLSESDIKISYLDLQSGLLKARYQYNSYKNKSLERIECKVEFNLNHTLTLNDSPNIRLGAFSKEILKFNNEELNEDLFPNQPNKINYQLNCEINFDKGKEYLIEESVLFLIPNSNFRYR